VWIWTGGAITVVAILVAFSSTVYRGQSSRDFPVGSGPNVAADNSGTGSDNMLALGSFGIAIVAAGGTVLVARVTRQSASLVDRDSPL